MPEPQLQRACACGGGCAKCQTGQPSQEPVRVQTKQLGSSHAGHTAAPPMVHDVLASSGQPLDASARAFFEPRFGHDFSRVRVHSNEAAAQSAREVNAHAYTVGRNIVFGDNRFAPDTYEGRRLLSHELTHVVQQSGRHDVIQRSPVPGTGETSDVKAARARGRAIAKRIRNHTKVSKEVRAKINSELTHLQGAAKEAYLEEVRPALMAFTEIEMPAMQMIPPPPSIAADPFAPGWYCRGRYCMTDDEIYAPLIEAKKGDDEAAAQLKAEQINQLREKTKGWGADQDFAIGLLDGVLRVTNAPDSRAVLEAIRKPILIVMRNG